jgi:predicted nucleic acid-binding protein
MREAVYLDSNSIVYWALGSAGSEKQDEQRCAQAFDALVASDASIACSPVSLAEFTSTLWSIVRSGKTELAHFDTTAANGAVERLMSLVSTGRIRVNNLQPGAFAIGMAIVAAGTREKQCSLRTWDAIHLHEACQWSRMIGQQVTIATTDADFRNAIDVFPEFGRYVDVRDLTVA